MNTLTRQKMEIQIFRPDIQPRYRHMKKEKTD